MFVKSHAFQVLEHRLHRSLVKFNETIASNRELRADIDKLRCERAAFDGVCKKLQIDLGERKQRLAQIIEVANVIYIARDRMRVANLYEPIC